MKRRLKVHVVLGFDSERVEADEVVRALRDLCQALNRRAGDGAGPRAVTVRYGVIRERWEADLAAALAQEAAHA